MKRILILTLLVALTRSMMAQKFGHVDAQTLMQMMPGTEKANLEYEKKAKELQGVLEGLQKEYNMKVKQYQENPPATESGQQLLIREIQTLEANQQEFAKTANDELVATEQRLMEPLINAAKEAIEAVGKEGGFTYIFDSSVGVLLYEGGGEDIMPLVKSKLGIVEE